MITTILAQFRKGSVRFHNGTIVVVLWNRVVPLQNLNFLVPSLVPKGFRMVLYPGLFRKDQKN